MSPLLAPLQISRSSQTGVNIAQVEHPEFTDIYLHITPANSREDATQQIRAIYERLFDTLHSINATPHNLISQKLFFSDLADHYALHQTTRQQVCSAHQQMPNIGALTCLQQQPVTSGHCVELQAHIVIPKDTEPMAIQHLDDLPNLTTGSIIDHKGLRHIHLQNLTGTSNDFATQTNTMFATAKDILKNLGASFHDVVRTWIYLPDLKGDYNTFNAVRTAFFKRIGLSRIPASTGIQGGAYPPARRCMMDLYALQSNNAVHIAPMKASTMNEAPEYGSSFVRGMTVTHAGYTTAYVSGTASINNRGEVVHIGDIKGQAHRMFENVEALLEAQGASLNDLVSAITYLKEPHFFDTFNQVAQQRGLPSSLPNAITIADVCRPEWLCEIETIAIFPERV